MTSQAEIEQIINQSFLARVPEVMSRGGFTLESAIAQAHQEEQDLCVEMCEGRTERARLAWSAMAATSYARLRVRDCTQRG